MKSLNSKTVQKTVAVTPTSDDGYTGQRNTISQAISRGTASSHFIADNRLGGDALRATVMQVSNCVIVDTLGIELPNVQPTQLDRAYGRIDEQQETVEDSVWAKGDLRAASGKQSFRVRYVDKTNTLHVEGSAAIHNQGHNVVSSPDVGMAAFTMLRAVKKRYGLDLPASVGYRLACGLDALVTRIDYCLLLKLPHGISKAELITQLAIAGIKAGIPTSLYPNESVYFDQSSQLESLKIYDKTAELGRARKGGLPNVDGVELLMELSRRTLRMEFVLRKKRLKSIAESHFEQPHPKFFTEERLAEIALSLLENYVQPGIVNMRLDYEDLLKIPLPYRSTVAHWQNGMAVLDMLKSERVRQEHAEYLRRNFNLNILAPPPDESEVPLDLRKILAPENFFASPWKCVSGYPHLFHDEDMDVVRETLRIRAEAEASNDCSGETAEADQPTSAKDINKGNEDE